MKTQKKKKKSWLETELVTLHNNVLTHWAVGRRAGSWLGLGRHTCSVPAARS